MKAGRENKKESEGLKIGKWKSLRLKDRRKRVKKGEQSLRDLWKSINWTYICMWESHKERRLNEVERIFEDIMAENFPSLMNNMSINTQEAQLTPRSSTSSN